MIGAAWIGKNSCFESVWHEDVGNYIYSIKQDGESVVKLEKRLEQILAELKRRY